MQYIVRPTEYHRGYCPTICETMESAEEELALMRKYTDFEWEIVEEPDEDGEDDLNGLSDDERVAFMNEFHRSCRGLFEELAVSKIISEL